MPKSSPGTAGGLSRHATASRRTRSSRKDGDHSAAGARRIALASLQSTNEQAAPLQALLPLRAMELELESDGEPGVAFEVVDRNPVVVRSPNGGSSSMFRSGEKGELRDGGRGLLGRGAVGVEVADTGDQDEADGCCTGVVEHELLRWGWCSAAGGGR
nr:unnamed protein product [Digitaria exilis]